MDDGDSLPIKGFMYITVIERITMDIKKIIPNFLVLRIIVKIIAKITRVTTSPKEVIAKITFVVNESLSNKLSKETVRKLSTFTRRPNFTNKDNDRNDIIRYKKLNDLSLSIPRY